MMIFSKIWFCSNSLVYAGHNSIIFNGLLNYIDFQHLISLLFDVQLNSLFQYFISHKICYIYQQLRLSILKYVYHYSKIYPGIRSLLRVVD